MTYAEVILWQSLRGNKLGVRFRRQVPIGKLVADFAALPAGLVVEIDGDHLRGMDDRRRDAWLGSKGFRVMRFWNNEVIEAPEACVYEIVAFLEGKTGGRLHGELPPP